MGDDADAPNARSLDLPEGATLADLVEWLRVNRAGASVWGGATWVLRLGGTAVAVLGQDPDSITVIGDRTMPLDDADRPHLEYLLRHDLAAMLDLVRADPARTDLRELSRRA